MCRFVIGREKPGEQSEVAQLIQQTLEQERWQREMMEQRYNQYMDEQEVSDWEKPHSAVGGTRVVTHKCTEIRGYITFTAGVETKCVPGSPSGL